MRILEWIDINTSPYDNDLKIGLMLLLTAIVLCFTFNKGGKDFKNEETNNPFN